MTTLVTITNGLYRNEEVNGTFELVSEWKPTNKPVREGQVTVLLAGVKCRVLVDRNDCVIDGDHVQIEPKVETETEISERIEKRFNVMDKMAKGSIAGVIKSLIISGAPGVGKTFTLERELNKASEKGLIRFESVKGKCSSIGLYIKLWECREDNSVLLLDDVDVFSNEDSLNLLKAALDTGEQRIVSWQTASSYLEDMGIDKSFEFRGTVIFISNMDFDREIERGSKLAPHIDALISRSIYLDLGVHTKKEILVRVKQVVHNTDMLIGKGLTSEQIDSMLSWVEKHVNQLRNLSLRTMLHIADMVLTDSEEWQDIASVTMLKSK